MITLYGHTGPNPFKVFIALEELGLPYRVEIVDVWQGAGNRPEFLAISPNGKVPAIRDETTGQTVFESNAILLHLAEQAGRLLPSEPAARAHAIQLLFFQASAIGPMFGQRAWFTFFAPEKPAYAVQRYRAEGERLNGVVERLLQGRSWFLDEYSIVDIAHFGWLYSAAKMGYGFADYPSVADWHTRMEARPAVQRALAALPPGPDFSKLDRAT